MPSVSGPNEKPTFITAETSGTQTDAFDQSLFPNADKGFLLPLYFSRFLFLFLYNFRQTFYTDSSETTNHPTFGEEAHMFEKLEKQTLSGRVYAQLEALITGGEWDIGSRIPREADLMESLGVSRNTLREAIRGLVQVGLLETRQGDGTFVTANSELSAILHKRMRRSSVLEALEVQHALDREAAALACRRRTDEDLERLDLFAAQCREAMNGEAEDPDAFKQADWNLHRAVVAASGNVLLADLYESLFEKLQISITVNRGIAGSRYEVGHPELIAAIRERDAARAARAVDDYIARFKAPHEQEHSGA